MPNLTSRLAFAAAVGLIAAPALAATPAPPSAPPSAEDAALMEAIIGDLVALFGGDPVIGPVEDPVVEEGEDDDCEAWEELPKECDPDNTLPWVEPEKCQPVCKSYRVCVIELPGFE